jgi:hypothetical protein
MLGTAQAEAYESLERAREPCERRCIDEAEALAPPSAAGRSAEDLAGLCRLSARVLRTEGERVRPCLLEELAATLAEMLENGK